MFGRERKSIYSWNCFLPREREFRAFHCDIFASMSIGIYGHFTILDKYVCPDVDHMLTERNSCQLLQ